MRHTSPKAALFFACCALAFGSGLAAQQRSWAIAARPELSIGEADGDDVYLFKNIAGARFLPDGRIVVAEGDLAEVRIYGKDGRFEKKFGRKGQGPGEFTYISGLWLTKPGAIALLDTRQRRISIFSFDGVLQQTLSLHPPQTLHNLDIFFGSFANGDVALASLDAGKRGPGIPVLVPDRVNIARFDPNGEYRESLGEADGLWRNDRHVIPFSAVPFGTVIRDSLYIIDDYTSAIEVRGPGGVVGRKITAPPVKQASGNAVWTTLESKLRERGRSGQLSLEYIQRDLVPRDNHFPQIGGLVADDLGNIWVKAYDPFRDALYLRPVSALTPTPGGEWRVLRSDGRHVATARLPDGVRPLEIKGNRLLGVSIDEFDVQRVVVHTIQR